MPDGPWTKYQQSAGPWNNYQAPVMPETAPVDPSGGGVFKFGKDVLSGAARETAGIVSADSDKGRQRFKQQDPSGLYGVPGAEPERRERPDAYARMRQFGAGGTGSGGELVGRAIPGMAAAGFVPELGVERALAPIFGRAAPALGTIAESAATGAESEALQRGDPAQGAGLGAIAGAVPGVGGPIGRAVWEHVPKGRSASVAGGHIGGMAGLEYIASHLGIPGWVFPTLYALSAASSRSSPAVERAIGRVGAGVTGTAAPRLKEYRDAQDQ